MRKINIQLLLLVVLVACGQKSKEEAYSVAIESLPTLPNDSLGVSAPVGGVLDSYVIVAGGCNFPDIPAADGGVKTYYKDIWAIHEDSLKDGRWQRVGELPFPLAYAVSIPTSKGLFCAGGMNGEGRFNNAFFVNYVSKTKAISIIPASPLPFSVDNAGSCIIDNKIYVFGGNQEGQQTANLLSYDILLDQWTILDSLENENRVQPIVIAIDNGLRKGIFISGGFSVTNKGVQVFTDGVIYDLSLRKWSSVDSPVTHTETITFSGGMGTVLNDSLLICMGGVNKEIFTDGLTNSILLSEAKEKKDTSEIEKLKQKNLQYMTQSPRFYKFNRGIWLYNLNSKEWIIIDSFEQTALAGAHLIQTKFGILIFNGEIKPGVRTPSIKLIKIQ